MILFAPFRDAVYQAVTIMRFMTKSTGIKSATQDSSHNMVLNKPLLTAETIPVGPLKLSTHPLTGSLKLERTKNKIEHEAVQQIIAI